jgi:hypothetical protein
VQQACNWLTGRVAKRCFGRRRVCWNSFASRSVRESCNGIILPGFLARKHSTQINHTLVGCPPRALPCQGTLIHAKPPGVFLL